MKIINEKKVLLQQIKTEARGFVVDTVQYVVKEACGKSGVEIGDVVLYCSDKPPVTIVVNGCEYIVADIEDLVVKL